MVPEDLLKSSKGSEMEMRCRLGCRVDGRIIEKGGGDKGAH